MSTPAGRWDGFLQGGGLKEPYSIIWFTRRSGSACGVPARLSPPCLPAAGCPVVDRSDNPSG